jgi:hypothetical protein
MKRNRNNTRVANTAITLTTNYDFNGKDYVDISAIDFVHGTFGSDANNYGYISSLTLDPKDVEYVEWDGTIYQPINANLRFKVKGPKIKVLPEYSDGSYTHGQILRIYRREGAETTQVTATLIMRKLTLNIHS